MMSIMAMFEFHWILVFQLVYSTHSYQLQCPDISQRPLRASGYCTRRLRSKYTCLYDTNMLSFSEQCDRNADFVTPGEKYVISGNLRNVDCSSERYQPFRLWSNVSGECLHQKSLCQEEGQVIANNGSLTGDRTCRCDYTKGYMFTQQPKLNCTCTPTEEDCSCYISKCPEGSILTSDYECVEEKHHVNSKCPIIVIGRDGLQIPKIKKNAEKEKQQSTMLVAVSAICLLILTYSATVFVVLITEWIIERKKGVSYEVEDTGKKSIENNEEENSTPTSKLLTEAVKLTTTNDAAIVPTHTVEPIRLERVAHIKMENNPAEENLKSDLNTQPESNYAKLIEAENVLKLKDAEILELKEKLRVRDEERIKNAQMIEEKNIENTNKERENREEEARNRKTIVQLEMEKRYLYNTVQELKGNIRVFCRVRPLLNHEKQGHNGTVDHINYIAQKTIVVITTRQAILDKKQISKSFTFDKVFNNEATQHDVFKEISQLVQSALDGYNVCIFAYGQTGSGKTYTMEGTSVNNDDENRGMIPRAVLQIFKTIRRLDSEGWKYNVHASCLEIYGDEINDLLCDTQGSPKPEIKVIKDEVIVSNLTIKPVSKETEVYELLEKASKTRKKAATKSNPNSSRSHSLFTLRIKGENNINTDTAKSTLTLVDLAGSERHDPSVVDNQQKKEAIDINLSLSALGKFIRALRDKNKFLPFRDFKLTQLLHKYIGGNSKILMFVNVSPKKDCVDETINSLVFATEANKCVTERIQKNK